MVLLRPQTLLAAFGKPMPRSNIGAKGVQIYAPGAMSWAKKALIIRNAPYTIENPTIGQMEARVHFAKIASKAKGMRGLRNGLPGAASFIQEEMANYKADHSMPPEEYPSRQRRTFHTAEELRRILMKKLGKRPIPPTRGAPRREVLIPEWF